MSRMVIRPPAARFHLTHQQGPLVGRQTYGAVDQSKMFGGAQGGNVDTTGRQFQTTWQDRIQVNPAHEQPRLIFYSGAQPFIRWGLMRRFVRTFMAASPRFQGRWAYIGLLERQYTERARMSGNIAMRRPTYVYPRFQTGPRIVTRLGPRSGG
jgi:hypothetical protein